MRRPGVPHAWFTGTAWELPDALALVAGGRVLDRASAHVARLVTESVGPGRRIALAAAAGPVAYAQRRHHLLSPTPLQRPIRMIRDGTPNQGRSPSAA